MRIFIIAAFFPPINMIGAVRPYQLAKYLVAQGHEVTVFTSYKDNYVSKDYNADISNINIIDVGPHSMISTLDFENPDFKKFNIIKKIMVYFMYPDHYFFAKKIYVKEIEKNIAVGNKPDLIISMALPFSLHCVARDIKNKYPDIKWFADNRDLWATTTYRKMPMFMRGIDKWFEKKILNSADNILVVTNHMKKVMGEYLNANINVIRNGLFLENPENENKGIVSSGLIYTGGLYAGLRDINPLFKALNILRSDKKIEFYGSEKNVVQAYKEKYPNLNILNFEKKPRHQILEIQKSAEYLIIALGTNAFEKGVLTGKFYEYVAARKPIIALCDEDGELAFLINKYKLGIATRDSEKIARYISENKEIATSIPVELTSDFQFERLISLIKELN